MYIEIQRRDRDGDTKFVVFNTRIYV